MKQLNILLTADFYDRYIDKFKSLGKRNWIWKRLPWPEPEEVPIELLYDIDVLICRKDINEERYSSAKRLKLFQLVTAGYDHIDLQRARAYGIPVCNNGGANAVSVAEHVFLMILALYRQLLFHHNAVTSGPWVNRKYDNKELFEKTLGIVGLGNIGRRVAQRAKAFEMNIIYTDPQLFNSELEKKLGVRRVSLEELLKYSDIVTFHTPLTTSTKGMINGVLINKMRPGALLINTARGGIHDENAIIRGLESGHLGGVGLDVFTKEPLPLESPLCRFKNVILTPHCGPSSETPHRVIKNILTNIYNIDEGRVPLFQAIHYK